MKPLEEDTKFVNGDTSQPKYPFIHFLEGALECITKVGRDCSQMLGLNDMKLFINDDKDRCVRFLPT
jgi:hypothetical protein